VYDPAAHRDSVMFTVTEREAYARLLQIGLTDLLRVHDAGAGPFTWWDYRRLGFQKNRGWRIDHVLGNAAAVARIREVVVDREARKGILPSDHAPVIARFA
jgi:exodeoxyribonuclease-3